mmetsp:Transcript_29889/g.96459  ORF Transcript_29889/g.96459 Transcript_29889/m.96459 type:complete len:313 (-) Transcript_29889:369-1307(-)
MAAEGVEGGYAAATVAEVPDREGLQGGQDVQVGGRGGAEEAEAGDGAASAQDASHRVVIGALPAINRADELVHRSGHQGSGRARLEADGRHRLGVHLQPRGRGARLAHVPQHDRGLRARRNERTIRCAHAPDLVPPAKVERTPRPRGHRCVPAADMAVGGGGKERSGDGRARRRVRELVDAVRMSCSGQHRAAAQRLSLVQLQVKLRACDGGVELRRVAHEIHDVRWIVLRRTAEGIHRRPPNAEARRRERPHPRAPPRGSAARVVRLRPTQLVPQLLPRLGGGGLLACFGSRPAPRARSVQHVCGECGDGG